MNRNFSLSSLLAASTIAITVLFSGNANATIPCRTIEARSNDLIASPLVAVLTIPGIALAATLYVSGRAHQD